MEEGDLYLSSGGRIRTGKGVRRAMILSRGFGFILRACRLAGTSRSTA